MTDLWPHVAHECRQRRQAPSIPTTCRLMTRSPAVRDDDHQNDDDRNERPSGEEGEGRRRSRCRTRDRVGASP